MNRHWTAVGTVLAVAGITSLVTARRIEAQYASPVKVMNTSASPAISSDINQAGRIPYIQTVVQPTLCNGAHGGNNPCNFLFDLVPPGHRLVLQQISGHVFISGTPTYIQASLVDHSNDIMASVSAPPQQESIFGGPVLGYIDAGDQALIQVNVFAPFGTTMISAPQQVTISGYLLDCSAAPCSAIAQ
jgi:hypothetical protein